MVASSSIAIGEGMHVGPFYFLTRHVVFLACGIALALWLMRTELKTIEQHSQLLLLACFVLLLLVFVPGIGRTRQRRAALAEPRRRRTSRRSKR